MALTVVRLENVSKEYQLGEANVVALRNISLNISFNNQVGEFFPSKLSGFHGLFRNLSFT